MDNEKAMACEKKRSDVPIWHRYTLTIEEAAGYYHIGETKLRMLVDEHPNEDFFVMKREPRPDQAGKIRAVSGSGNGCITAFPRRKRQIADFLWHSYAESQTCAMIRVQVWLSFLFIRRDFHERKKT